MNQLIKKLIIGFSIIFICVHNGFSQSIQDMQKMKLEYEKLMKDQKQAESISNQNINFGLPNAATITPYQLRTEEVDSVDTGMEFFGYNFFTKRDTVAFWENLPIPSNYLLGPGDEIIVSIWGETKLRNTYIISREGKIYAEQVGIMSLVGKTIEEAKKYLIFQYGQLYATLRGVSPSTFLDISLGQLRSINVNFVGEIKFPGVYPIHPFSNVITGLIQAGGLKTTGSLRNVQIRRNDELISTIDFYDYIIKGDISDNIQLRDQDVVVVPIRYSTITIDSAVVRPGIYESSKDESIKKIIDYAGGPLFTASSVIAIERIIPLSKREVSKQISNNFYIYYENSDLTMVQDGDYITLPSIIKPIDQVEIIGQVKSPGVYNYFNGMNLKELIDLGGGFDDTTFWKSVYPYQAEIVRRNPKAKYESVIEIDLNEILNRGSATEIELRPLDRFVVHANPNFFEKENAQILGEVNIPGSYPLMKDNETLISLIERAGQLTPKALKNGISIYRDKKYFESITINDVINNSNFIDDINNEDEDDKIRVAWQNEQVILMPGDSIIVKEATRTINVFGEVYNPGIIEYRKGKPLKFYLNSAGGITNKGNRKRIIVIHANGVVSPKRWYSSPKIDDGATVIVNSKEIVEPLNITQFATNWTSIISSMITAIVLSQQLSN